MPPCNVSVCMSSLTQLDCKFTWRWSLSPFNVQALAAWRIIQDHKFCWLEETLLVTTSRPSAAQLAHFTTVIWAGNTGLPKSLLRIQVSRAPWISPLNIPSTATENSFICKYSHQLSDQRSFTLRKGCWNIWCPIKFQISPSVQSELHLRVRIKPRASGWASIPVLLMEEQGHCSKSACK